MANYEYPPSQHILKYGPINPSSHFFAKGSAIFESGQTVDCEFEVAYTHEGRIIVALYLDTRDIFDTFGTKQSEGYTVFADRPLPNQRIISLKGVSTVHDSTIEMTDCYLLSMGTIIGMDGYPQIFEAQAFTVTSDMPPAVNDEFQIIGIDLSNRFYNIIEFDIGFPHKLKIEPIELESIRTYPNQPLAKLTIPSSTIANNSTSEHIANLWCALISICTGRDVQWVNKTTIASHTTTSKIWVSRPSSYSFKKTIAVLDGSQFESSVIDQRVLHLVKVSFENITKGNLSLAILERLVDASHKWVHYQLQMRSGYDRARLISTYTEAFILELIEAAELTLPEILNAEEINKLSQALKTSSIVKDNVTSSNAHYKTSSKRQKEVIGKLSNTIRRINESSLEAKTRLVFKNSLLDDKWVATHVNPRIESFVNTRNTIAHSGKYPDQERKILQWHYFNLVMMIPLIIFAQLGYDGDYDDPNIRFEHLVERPSDEPGR